MGKLRERNETAELVKINNSFNLKGRKSIQNTSQLNECVDRGLVISLMCSMFNKASTQVKQAKNFTVKT